MNRFPRVARVALALAVLALSAAPAAAAPPKPKAQRQPLAPARVRTGLENLEKHVENMRQFELSPVIAINKFATDTDEELAVVKARCAELGVPAP